MKDDRKEETSPPLPDLQELVRKCGGYNKVTPEAWREWDKEVNQVYESLHHFYWDKEAQKWLWEVEYVPIKKSIKVEFVPIKKSIKKTGVK